MLWLREWEQFIVECGVLSLFFMESRKLPQLQVVVSYHWPKELKKFVKWWLTAIPTSQAMTSNLKSNYIIQLVWVDNLINVISGTISNKNLDCIKNSFIRLNWQFFNFCKLKLVFSLICLYNICYEVKELESWQENTGKHTYSDVIFLESTANGCSELVNIFKVVQAFNLW